jgi:hypothetical protein
MINFIRLPFGVLDEGFVGSIDLLEMVHKLTQRITTSRFHLERFNFFQYIIPVLSLDNSISVANHLLFNVLGISRHLLLLALSGNSMTKNLSRKNIQIRFIGHILVEF